MNDMARKHNTQEQPRQIPDLCSERKTCCGCFACFSICPVGAIQMLTDEKGFPYPAISSDKCIRCYRCIDVCAFKKDQNCSEQ